MNCRPTLRKAYNDVLEKYDALIMPTIPIAAVKLPPLDLTPKGKLLLPEFCNESEVTFRFYLSPIHFIFDLLQYSNIPLNLNLTCI